MTTANPALALQVETVAELRELYRAAEARAARLRFMSASGRQLAMADEATIQPILDDCAERLAHFLGYRQGAFSRAPDAAGLPVPMPGRSGQAAGRVVIDGLDGLADIADAEDRETCRLHLEMIGATIDRIARERERAGLLAILRDREQRLEILVGQVLTAQEEERLRVSRELHDGVAQTATALLRLLEGAGTGRAAAIPAADRARFAGIARDLVSELRAVIRGLRPTILDDLGLEAGLRALAESLEAEGFAVTLRIAGPSARRAPHEETALFRVAQEAMNNIRKHAGGPCAVDIALDLRPGADHHALCISDAGRGLDRAAAQAVEGRDRARFGIDVMRERMAAIGGTLRVEARPGGGTRVVARFPGTGRP